MLRNREIRQFIQLFSFLAAVLIIVGFFMNTEAGILMIFASVLFAGIFWVFTKARYQSIAKISNQIDQILHNIDYLYLEEAKEGELSILQSEITKMTLRIREQNEQLKREKQHLSDSLADIAHQLRTPLTSAVLILSLLENNPEESKKKEFLREMEELLVRMDWLITSLLKLSRLDAGVVVFQYNEIEVYSVLKEALRPLLIPMELHGIVVTIESPREIMIYGDSVWLSEAFQNILKNCMESIGENGKIEISCSDNPLFTEISIHDSGAGFQKEEIFSLFTRFHRGKSQTTAGYGIGLALCKMIITRQGGTITANNHPHGGAVFVIRFPK